MGMGLLMKRMQRPVGNAPRVIKFMKVVILTWMGRSITKTKMKTGIQTAELVPRYPINCYNKPTLMNQLQYRIF